MTEVSQQAAKPQFSKLRAMLWPIEGWECKKVIPMALMMAGVLFNYSMLRGTKDTLVVTAAGSGVEVISYLKLGVVLPMAILFLILYTKMSNMLQKKSLFYATQVPILMFFVAFAFYLYPNREIFQPDVENLFAMQEAFPRFKWIFPIYYHWLSSAFYVLSELWGSVVLSLLFWQFANDVTRVSESKRFYAFFGMIANAFVFLAGYLLEVFSKMQDSVSGQTDFGQTLHYICSCVGVVGLLIAGIYWWLNKYVLTDVRYYEAAAVKKKKSKQKLSMGESFKYLFTSKYLGFIAMLVICYGISINLIEVTWKHQLKLVADGDPNKFNAQMGGVLKYIGLVTMVFMLIGANILRKFSWLVSASITPFIFLVTGGLFFAFILFYDALTPFIVALGFTPLAMAAWLGTTQNIFSKGTKYSLFDPTKEMSYIPLDEELRGKGKAAVDVVGGRLGKSGGALIQAVLLIVISGGQMDIVPYIAGIVFLTLFVWFRAIKGLNVGFKQKVAEREAEEKQAAQQ